MSEQSGDAVSDLPAQPDTDVPRSPEVDPETIARIADRARRLVRERIRAALDGSITADPTLRLSSDLDDEQLDRIAGEEAQRAAAESGRAVGALLHVSVVHAVSQELGIEVEDALEHPAVDQARERLQQDGAGPGPGAGAVVAGGDDPPAALASASAPETRGTPAVDRVSRPRPPRQQAVLLDAVHVSGIETLTPGDADIELRLAEVGIDVRKPSTAKTIGRLRWNEVRSVAVQRPRRGLAGRRRPAVLVARTDRGEVTFELPGVSDEEITDHLDPLIARNCAGYAHATAD